MPGTSCLATAFLTIIPILPAGESSAGKQAVTGQAQEVMMVM